MAHIKRMAASVLISLLFFVAALPLHSDVVCRAPGGIEGCDEPAARARSVLRRERTRDVSECEVYLTMHGGVLYAHSNFLSDGHDVPTKLATESIHDLRLVFANLFAAPRSGQLTAEQTAQVRRAHASQVRYYLDQSLFDAEGQPRLDLGDAQNLFVVFDRSSTPRRLRRVNSVRGPPSYVAQWRDSLFVRVRQGFSPEELFRTLGTQPIRRSDVRLLSMINDSALNDEIVAARLQDVSLPFSEPSTAALDALFQQNRGRTIVILGHIEEDRFVCRDTAGKAVLLNLPLRDVEAMAAAQGCNAILLGCHSAEAMPGVGVIEAVKPVATVRRLAQALDERNYEAFLQRLTGNELSLVFDVNALRGSPTRVEADVYQGGEPAEKAFTGSNRIERLVFMGPVAAAAAAASSPSASHRWWVTILILCVAGIVLILLWRWMRTPI